MTRQSTAPQRGRDNPQLTQRGSDNPQLHRGDDAIECPPLTLTVSSSHTTVSTENNTQSTASAADSSSLVSARVPVSALSYRTLNSVTTTRPPAPPTSTAPLTQLGLRRQSAGVPPPPPGDSDPAAGVGRGGRCSKPGPRVASVVGAVGEVVMGEIGCRMPKGTIDALHSGTGAGISATCEVACLRFCNISQTATRSAAKFRVSAHKSRIPTSCVNFDFLGQKVKSPDQVKFRCALRDRLQT